MTHFAGLDVSLEDAASLSAGTAVTATVSSRTGGICHARMMSHAETTVSVSEAMSVNEAAATGATSERARTPVISERSRSSARIPPCVASGAVRCSAVFIRHLDDVGRRVEQAVVVAGD